MIEDSIDLFYSLRDQEGQDSLSQCTNLDQDRVMDNLTVNHTIMIQIFGGQIILEMLEKLR